MNDYAVHGYGMGLGWLIPILLIAIFIYFIKNLQNSDTSAEDILDKQYTNGIIDTQEYTKRKKALKS